MHSILFVLVAAFLAGSFPTQATAQQCEVRCFTSCSYGRCCRRCVRQCFAPRHEGAPHHYASPHQARSQFASSFEIDPDLALIGLGILVLALLAALSATSNHTTGSEIAAIERSAFSARAQARDYENQTHAINDYIASAEADAFQQGRKAADDEWKEFTRHD